LVFEFAIPSTEWLQGCSGYTLLGSWDCIKAVAPQVAAIPALHRLVINNFVFMPLHEEDLAW